MAPEEARVTVRSPDWREAEKESLLGWVKSGVLKKTLSPRYDTLIVEPGRNLTEQVAFCLPRWYQGKLPSDTNMDMSSMLGTPNAAIFQYMRVHFEKYHSLEDAVSWKETASLELMMGHGELALRTSLGAMDPILPRGGKKKIGTMIKTGVIRFWPWYEASLPSILVDSCDAFHVRVIYGKPFSPKNEMRIKISLGPWFFTR